MKSIYFTAFSALLLACGSHNTSEPEKVPASSSEIELTKAQFGNAGIQMVSATITSVARELKVSGKIDVPPQNMVSISAPLGGYLKASSLLPGMPVKKGQRIATLEDPQYITMQQDYLTSKANIEYLKAEYDRQAELNKSKSTSDKAFQLAKAEYQKESVAVKALAEKLRLIGISPEHLTENSISRTISIISPISGYVALVNVNVGKYVTPSDVLFELVNPEDIHLALKVFEKDLPYLQLGQKVSAWTNANPDKKYFCEVILIGKNLSAERTAEVHCHFEKYDHDLIPGMYMNAVIETTNAQATAVPDESVVTFEGNDYIFIETGLRKYKMVPVSNLSSFDGKTAIHCEKQDLAGAKIVSKGAYTLLMALKNAEEEE